jgi:hypothetical protein
MLPELFPTSDHPNSRTVIRCLTIAMEDARPITIALEHIMPGWSQRHLDEQIKHPTASPIGLEAHP